MDQLLEGLLGEGGRRRRGATRLDEGSKWDSTTPIMYAIDTTEFSEYNLLLLQIKRQSDQQTKIGRLPLEHLIRTTYNVRRFLCSKVPTTLLLVCRLFLSRSYINSKTRGVLDAFVEFLEIESKTLPRT